MIKSKKKSSHKKKVHSSRVEEEDNIILPQKPKADRLISQTQDVADHSGTIQYPDDEDDNELESFLFPELHKPKSSASLQLESLMHEEDQAPQTTSRPKRGLPAQSNAPQPAWVDPDSSALAVTLIDATPQRGSKLKKKLRKSMDEKVISAEDYESRLRTQFEKIHARSDVSWADLDAADRSSSDDDDDSESDGDNASQFLRSTTKRIVGDTSGMLPPGILGIQHRVDANKAHPNTSPLSAVKFHPNGQLALVASTDCSVRVYHVDGRVNAKVQGVVFQDLPVRSADFTADGKEVIAAGRRKYFYSYSLETGHVKRITQIKGCTDKSYERMIVSPDNQYLAMLGKDGVVQLLSRHTKQSIGTLKMNGTLDAAQFSLDGSSLFTVGNNAEVYVWDLKTRRCAGTFQDADAFNCSSLAVSPSGHYLATGSRSGVVNIYDIKSRAFDGEVSPVKSFMNLTTPISSLAFNSDSQILSAASVHSPNQLKMFHIPSMSTFSNWPTQKSPLRSITCLDFSPHSGYFMVGNTNGRALLYRLLHYQSS